MPLSAVQYEVPGRGRGVGVIKGESLCDVTAIEPGIRRITDAYFAAKEANQSLQIYLEQLAGQSPATTFKAILSSQVQTAGNLVIRPPIDHIDPYRVLITGTGLTHLGSMQSRDQMHAGIKVEAAPEPPMTDSRRMFEWGLAGGRPAAGTRGVPPEWFYKGNGTMLRACGEPLDIPEFTADGGEEPEIVGCYVIDEDGRPVRLGFALGNEWSDHAVEKLNYLYLAPSKLRTCAIGPQLVIGHDFQEIELTCTVRRGKKVIYVSGPLWSGEKHMCHSLANMEDHHFKYPQHRRPGDVHLHFFGTSKLSYGSRDWKYADGDQIEISADGFSAPLVNVVRKSKETSSPVAVVPA